MFSALIDILVDFCEQRIERCHSEFQGQNGTLTFESDKLIVVIEHTEDEWILHEVENKSDTEGLLDVLFFYFGGTDTDTVRLKDASGIPGLYDYVAARHGVDLIREQG